MKTPADPMKSRPKEAMTQAQIRLPQDLHDASCVAAAKAKTTFSALVRGLLQQYVEASR